MFEDYQGRQFILTDSAEEHISDEHPEIVTIGIYDALRETVSSPDVVIYSGKAYHYFRMRHNPPYANKYVKVVVETENGDLYIRTAYPTGRLIGGTVIWEQKG